MAAEKRRRLLVVDDEPDVHYSFGRILEGRGIDLFTASSGEEAIRMLEEVNPEAALVDVRMAGMSGLDLLAHLRAEHARLPVVIMTAYASTEVTISSMREGAFDSIRKPFEIDTLLEVIDRALEAGRTALSAEERKPAQVAAQEAVGLIGDSAAMQDLYKAIGRVAGRDVAVLITGESGTGKELVARAVHEHSARVAEAFVALNCAAVPDSLLDTELFGHERGAFTGAVARTLGRFERADGGTLFLDEVGEMGLGAQAKLLRVLETGELERVGGAETLHVDVRLLAATNRDLTSAVADGSFREDLFYRLNVVRLHLPPLRERAADIPLLARHFLERYSRVFRRDLGGFQEGAEETLAGHPWPGNVRELENAIKRAVILSKGTPLTGEEVLASGATGARGGSGDPGSTGGRPADLALALYRATAAESDEQPTMDRCERLLLEAALAEAGGNVSQAARGLGLNRSTLRKRIARLGARTD